MTQTALERQAPTIVEKKTNLESRTSFAIVVVSDFSVFGQIDIMSE